jgi:hypothetical protein
VAGARHAFVRAAFALFLVLLPVFAGSAQAEWFVIPGVGFTFDGKTNLINIENPANTCGAGCTPIAAKAVLQGEVLWLSKGWVGVNGELTYMDGFIEQDKSSDCRDCVSTSGLLTAMGSLVISAPLSLTGHSLRPYAIGGFGLMRVTTDDSLNVFVFDEKLLALRVGGGAMGFLSDTVGVRFDLSHIRTLKGQGEGTGVSFGSRSVSLWRTSVGVVLRF